MTKNGSNTYTNSPSPGMKLAKIEAGEMYAKQSLAKVTKQYNQFDGLAGGSFVVVSCKGNLSGEKFY